MFRNLAICGVLGGIVAAAVIYSVGLPTDRPVVTDAAPPAPAAQKVVFANPQPSASQDIGGPLYAVAEPPAKKTITGSAAAGAIVIPDAHVTPITTEEVPAQRDGTIRFIATEVTELTGIPEKDKPFYFQAEVPYIAVEVKQGDKIPEGTKLWQTEEGKTIKVYRRVADGEFLAPNKVIINKENKWFRELHEGDKVKKDQLLAIIDTSLFYDEIKTRLTKMNGKEAERMASEKTRDEAKERLKTLEILRQRSPGSVTQEEYRGAQLTYDRYFFEQIQKLGELHVAERELAQALTQMRFHEIRSEVDGRIMAIYKKRGEAVKNLEQVVQIANQTELRLEGHTGVQNISQLPEGTAVVVEPSFQDRFKQAHPGHLYEISAVAVSKDKDNPLIVSASEDGSVRVWERGPAKDGSMPWWDQAAFKQKARFQHPVAVKALACTPPNPTAEDRIITGDAEGVCRIWNLGRDDSQEPMILAKHHRGAINCVAFSPDGRYCAAGGDDRNIVLWDTHDGHAVYTFPVGHLGGVTSIQFTPRSQLVSAGRDNRILIWSLGEKGARLDPTHFDRRGGDVPVLGVSPDGTQVFFDRGRELRILSLDGSTDGVLENPPGAPNFTTMAQFSPDGKLALAANGTEGQLQLWRLPTSESRGYELRQFVWTRSATTTAAFYPHDVPGKGFVVTGTKDGNLVIWSLPSQEEITHQVKAVISMAGDSIQSSSRQVSVWARIIPSPGGRPIVTGSTATMVLYPK